MARSSTTTTTTPDPDVEATEPVDGDGLSAEVAADQRDDGLDAEPPMPVESSQEPMTIPDEANYLVMTAEAADPNTWKAIAAVGADSQENAIRAVIKGDETLARRLERDVVWFAVVPKRSWSPEDVTLRPRDPVLTIGARRRPQ